MPVKQRALNRQNRPTINQAINKAEALKERLINSPVNLRRSVQKEFQNLDQIRPHGENDTVNIPIINSRESIENSDHLLNNYSELPLINLSQSNNTSEIEEYDNSSLNALDFLADENVIYIDTKAFFPFPTLNSEPGFECKIYNRLNCNQLTKSNSFQTNYDDNRNFKYLNEVSINNSSSTQNSISSDSSFLYTNSGSVSPQNTLHYSNTIMNQKPSLLQQPVASKSNRFGFKPGIANTPSVGTALPIQQQSQTKKPNSIAVNKETALTINNKMTKLHIDEPVSTLSSSKILNNTHQPRRTDSPGRTYLKPPASLPLKVQTSTSKSQDLVNKKILETQKNSISVSSMKPKFHESSSMSSIASSASSTNSNKNKTDNIHKSLISETNSKSIKSNLPNPKVSVKSPVAKSSALRPPSVVATKTVSPSPPQFQSNKIKPPPLTMNNNNFSHKRRLFSPYMPNIVPNNNNNNSNNSNHPSNSNDINNNLKENKLSSSETFMKNTDENLGANNEVNNSQNEQKAHKFKLYNNPNSLKSKMNVIHSLKMSKMPVKSNSLAQTSSKLDSMSNKIPKQTNKSLNLTTSREYKKTETHHKVRSSLNNGETRIKREDSAYCSSTSSTVSSQEVEISKFPVNNLLMQSNTNKEESNHNEQVEVKNDDLKSEPDQIEPEIKQLESSDDLINSEEFKSANILEEKIESIESTGTNQSVEKNEETQKPECANEDFKKAMDIESNDEVNEGDFVSIKPNSSGKKLTKRNSIKESIGELNELMSNTSLTLNDESKPNNACGKQRRTSSASLSQASGSSGSTHNSSAPMFRPPSNLPPTENGEVIQLDIETYRLLLQDLQNTKTILHKLVNVLREPSSSSFNNDNFDIQTDENQMTNSFISSLNQINMLEKIDQETQTD